MDADHEVGIIGECAALIDAGANAIIVIATHHHLRSGVFEILLELLSDSPVEVGLGKVGVR